LCKSKEHIAFACPKLANLRPKCAKCGGGHKTKNCGLKHYFCSSMGHTKNKCWRKNDKGPSAFTKFFEVLVNDEEATLAKLNCLCGIKHNVFYGIRMPKKRMHVQASIYGKVMEELLDNESGEA